MPSLQSSLEICVQREHIVKAVGHHAPLLVLADLLLEEVRLALERDELHKAERVLGVVDLFVAQLKQEAIRDKLDVLRHQLAVHAEQVDGQGFREELLLDDDGFADDFEHAFFGGLLDQVAEHETGKVGVESLVARDQLVREGQAGHEATLLEPEDGREAAAEEDALDGGESDHALAKVGVLARDPVHRPVSLFLHTGQRLDRVEQVFPERAKERGT